MFTEQPENFIQNSNIDIHAVSPDGYIKYANQYELEVLGYEESEYVGHHVSEFQVDKIRLDDMMTKLGNFETLTNYPAKVYGKEGIKYILYNSSVYENDGKFVHTRCFANEIPQAVYQVFLEEQQKLNKE